MIYDYYISTIHFSIHSEINFNTKNTDSRFLTTAIKSEKTIPIILKSIFSFPQLIEEPLYIKEDFKSTLTDMYEVRDYFATYASGKPHFARSYYSNNKILINYLSNTNILKNINFSIWNHIHLENLLLEESALILHACYLELNGKAILISAPSGTGKTTHANYLKEKYKAKIINGDKCLIQRINNQWYAFGFPLHGSSDECENITLPLSTIFILRQSSSNQIKELSLSEKSKLIFSETTVNLWNKVCVSRTFDLIEKLINETNICMLLCTNSIDSAITSFQYLSNKGVFNESL